MYFFDGENTSFDASLVIYIFIYIYIVLISHNMCSKVEDSSVHPVSTAVKLPHSEMLLRDTTKYCLNCLREFDSYILQGTVDHLSRNETTMSMP